MRNLVTLLSMYYHCKNTRGLISSFLQDILATIFLIGGSGLFFSIWRGVYFRLLLNYKYPGLFGRGFKIISSKNFSAGKNIWIKDGVSILAGGKISIGDNFVACERVALWSHEKGLRIGNNVAVGIGSYISATGGEVRIGNDVRIADHVRMYSFNHKFSNLKKTVAQQGYTREGIVIGDNVWIGSGAIILDGVTIKKNSVVAAGAVVSRNVQEGVVVAGVPAKIIKRIK